jgi:hypothetical protein
MESDIGFNWEETCSRVELYEHMRAVEHDALVSIGMIISRRDEAQRPIIGDGRNRKNNNAAARELRKSSGPRIVEVVGEALAWRRRE